MKYIHHIKVCLEFPNEDIGYFGEFDLKAFFQSYLWEICDVFVCDGYDGKGDGLVFFGVSYNSFHKFYSFSFCGGDKNEVIAEQVREHFKSLDYKCGDFEKTWVVAHNGRPRADGVQFSVKQK